MSNNAAKRALRGIALGRKSCLIAFVIAVGRYWRALNNKGWVSLAWLAVLVICSITIATGVSSTGGGAVGGSVGISSAVVGVMAEDIGLAVFAAAIGALAGTITFGLGGTIPATVVGCVATALFGEFSKHRHITRGRGGLFLLIFVLAMTVGTLAVVAPLSLLTSWVVVVPILLFLGMFTWLNAPFLWFSVGLTRGLLRRGLEL